jgi:hypothetical protein
MRVEPCPPRPDPLRRTCRNHSRDVDANRHPATRALNCHAGGRGFKSVRSRTSAMRRAPLASVHAEVALRFIELRHGAAIHRAPTRRPARASMHRRRPRGTGLHRGSPTAASRRTCRRVESRDRERSRSGAVQRAGSFVDRAEPGLERDEAMPRLEHVLAARAWMELDEEMALGARTRDQHARTVQRVSAP